MRREFFAGELIEVEEKGRGEEQQRQHAVEDEAFEVDLLGEVASPLMERGDEAAHVHEDEGGADGEEHGADGDGEAQDAGAEPAEEAGGGDYDADDFESVHAPELIVAKAGIEG